MSRSLSIGNEANIDIVDCLEYYKDDKNTEIIGLYIEEIKRGKKFLELAKEITPKKPIIAIYIGGSKAGNRALQSHTGSLAGNSKLYEGLFKETGIIKTDYVQEFLDIALIFSRGILPKGNKIGIITNSGGPGAMVANNAENHGLIVPEFSEMLQEELKDAQPYCKDTAAVQPFYDLLKESDITFSDLIRYIRTDVTNVMEDLDD